jgi:membrane protease YdiL (CAAX protease family)
MSSENLAEGRAPNRRMAIYLCLALMLVFPLFASSAEHALGSLAQSIGEIPARFVSEGAIWCFGLLVLGIALLGEPRTLASIGLRRPTRWTPLWGLGAAIVLLALGGLASFVTYNVLHATNHTPEQVEALVRGSLGFGLLLALRAGVIEEVLYRGLAIEQLAVLTGRRWLAALVATLAFIAVHAVHFDPRQLIPIATASFALAGIYLWRRNLWINIIAHTLIDAVGFSAVALHATSLY